MANDVKDTIQGAEREQKRHFELVELPRRLIKEKPLGTIGGVIVLALFITGIFADFLAPYGMNEAFIVDRLEPPSSQYILGTDQLGRDMATRIIYGARTSMIVGVFGSLICLITSTLIGMTSGFIGGKYDLIVQRIVDAVMCFPALLILLTIVAMLGPGIMQVTITIGVVFGISGSRVIRSAAISTKENTYMDAARAIGCSTTRTLIRHILPNILPAIIILTSTRMGGVILAEASLSFLGYGIPPPTPSWGGMLSGAGRQYMYTAPLLAIWPGLILSLVVYGINMLGDALRDLLDPRLRGGIGRFGKAKRKSLRLKNSQELDKG